MLDKDVSNAEAFITIKQLQAGDSTNEEGLNAFMVVWHLAVCMVGLSIFSELSAVHNSVL